MHEVVAEKQSWEFPEGHEIAPGRTTLKSLGGGNRYEVYLVWDERRFSVMVAKVLRPDLVEEVLPLGLHVASVIHYMAEEGWVHLDLKPDNLVMGIPPRVIDLSLARTIERAKRLTDYIGTNAYMPPEQCNPRGDVGPPADVWGLGATLYHAVAGRVPFRRPRSRADDAALEDRFPQLEDEPRAWRRPVPQALSDAILSCLEKNPADRPTAGE